MTSVEGIARKVMSGAYTWEHGLRLIAELTADDSRWRSYVLLTGAIRDINERKSVG